MAFSHPVVTKPVHFLFKFDHQQLAPNDQQIDTILSTLPTASLLNLSSSSFFCSY
jgi:hypothetical protein